MEHGFVSCDMLCVCALAGRAAQCTGDYIYPSRCFLFTALSDRRPVSRGTLAPRSLPSLLAYAYAPSAVGPRYVEYTPHRPHPRDRASTLITNQKPSLLKTPPLRREDRRRHGEGDRQRRKHLVVGFELDDRVNGAADGAAPRAALHHRESVGNEPHLGLSTRGGAQQTPCLCHTQHRAVASARSEAAGLASSRRARKAVDAAVVQTASATMPPRLSSYAGYTAWGHRGRGQRVHACEGQGQGVNMPSPRRTRPSQSGKQSTGAAWRTRCRADRCAPFARPACAAAPGERGCCVSGLARGPPPSRPPPRICGAGSTLRRASRRPYCATATTRRTGSRHHCPGRSSRGRPPCRAAHGGRASGRRTGAP